MRKAAMIALLTLATSLVSFAGMGHKKGKEKKKEKTECCVPATCCPDNPDSCK